MRHIELKVQNDRIVMWEFYVDPNARRTISSPLHTMVASNSSGYVAMQSLAPGKSMYEEVGLATISDY